MKLFHNIGLVIFVLIAASFAVATEISIFNTGLSEDCWLRVIYEGKGKIERDDIVPDSGKEIKITVSDGKINDIFLVCPKAGTERCNKGKLNLKPHPAIPMIQLHLDSKSPLCTFINEHDYQ